LTAGPKKGNGLVLMRLVMAIRVYWRDKRSVSIERTVKSDNGDVVLPPILVAKPIQGENEQEKLNQQHTKKPTKQQQLTEEISKSPLNNPKTLEPTTEDSDNNQDNNQFLGTPFNRVTDELVAARSRRVRFPTRYIKDI